MSNETNAIELATALTIAWVSNPNTRVTADEMPAFLSLMHKAVTRLVSPPAPVDEKAADAQAYAPAVSVRKSLSSPDHIISMIDGKPYRALRRHLSRHGLTPATYRDRYKLPADYPMVAPSYSQARSAVAKAAGLGRSKGPREAKASLSNAKPAAKRRSASTRATAPAPGARG